ncbi:MAG TPA: cyclic nucleotide-gated ion channel [Xanthobacteraceae bacterium]|nr:cyclic nucleotide-gated ion channel [Xanthobacteraceae bacterium]
MTKLRRRLYEILEQGPVGDSAGSLVSRSIVGIIVLNLFAVALESVPELQSRYRLIFWVIEMMSLLIFTIEYALRMWVAIEHPPYRHLPHRLARGRFATSPLGIIDLLAVLPFWFAFIVPGDVRVLLVFRIFRFFKLTRYSPGMRSLLDVLYAERRALFGCFIILIGMTLVSAALMHLIEGEAQPDKFGTIPLAMWWSIVTLGTIGYGDVVPITMLGKIAAGLTIFVGLIMIALPVGIVATAFSEQIHRRDFIITWGLVSRVPLFAELNASEISDIMQLLRAVQVEAGAVIVRRGEPAHSMYLIAAGEVEIELKNDRRRLGSGHFFGEIAVLRRARRSATVTAVTSTSLLVLDAQDFHSLMERDPRIADHINRVVRTRLGDESVTTRGDMVSEELGETHDQDAIKKS